jgi:hypothetical protein
MYVYCSALHRAKTGWVAGTTIKIVINTQIVTRQGDELASDKAGHNMINILRNVAVYVYLNKSFDCAYINRNRFHYVLNFPSVKILANSL